jgi:error-prone DNA polymerase
MAGLVVRPHRPPTRSGRTAVFLSLEDETGLVDVVVPEEVYHQYAYTIMHHPFLTITGRLERRGRAVQLLAQQVADILPQ